MIVNVNNKEIYSKSQIDLLWENASPESTFAPQSIDLDLSDYDWFIVSGPSGLPSTQLLTKGTGNIVGMSGGVVVRRQYTISDTGISFKWGEKSGSQNQQNDEMIPYQLYGLKSAARII